jgi:phospholipase C
MFRYVHVVLLVLAFLLFSGCGSSMGKAPSAPSSTGSLPGGTSNQTAANLTAVPSSIAPGGTSTLTWSSTDASSANIDHGVGTVATAGDITVSPTQTTTYTVTVTGPDGKIASASAMVTVNSAPPAGAVSGSGIANIQHIIWEFQENRSFDHYFGMLGKYREMHGLPNDVDGLPLDVTLTDRKGKLIHPFHLPTVCHDGLTPIWGATHVDYDDGKMDNFMHTANGSSIDPDGTRAMGYYDWTDLPYYYELAFQFATSDRMFSPIPSRTMPNRYAEFSGSSYGNIDSGSIPASALTIFDLLDRANVSWKYYLQTPGVMDLHAFSISQKDANKIRPIDEYFTDLAQDTLPAVAFIDRKAGMDEHPTNNIQHGAATVQGLIDPFLRSKAYANSVFFLSFDEGGGLYDHVPLLAVPAPDNIPPKLSAGDKPGDFTLSGFRVPFIAISPWVRAHYVSHVPRDLTAILKFIEVRYSLPNLTRRDAWVDDMTEMFDFSGPQLATAPPLPSQPQNGKCSPALEVSPEHK